MGKMSGSSIAFVIAVLMGIVAIAAVLVGPSLAERLLGAPAADTNGFGRGSGDFPTIQDPALKVEQVVEKGFALPTSMAFVDNSNLLVLEKNTGRVMLVRDGKLAKDPVLDLSPYTSFIEQGLLGIAVGKGQKDSSSSSPDVFIYLTEKDFFGAPRNRVYRYSWQQDSGRLTDPVKILDLPATPGPNHNGGKMVVGPDNYLYVVIGDLNRNGMLQNFKDGPAPDDTSVILKVDRDGKPPAAANAVLAGLPSSYYAYGIRNSFGLAFDPRTGVLWDTENGPEGYDEVNVVKPGFNSGWERVMGPIARTMAAAGAATDPSAAKTTTAEGREEEDFIKKNLVLFGGAHYADPVFSWKHSIGVTDIEFIRSGKLGEKYENNILVGDINNGNLYFMTVNSERNGIQVNRSGPLGDLVADDGTEAYGIFLGSNFGGITDIETGPDGYPYVLSFSGSLYRIVPNNK
jgi:glucose/arabinose dehydrogenase